MIELCTNLRKPLDQFVDCLWYSDGESRSHQKERLLPTGTVELVFKLKEDRALRIFDNACDTTGRCFSKAVVSGAYSHHFALDTSESSPTVGVHFRPGGASLILGVPLSELMDQHCGLEELWGRQAVEIWERLMEAPSTTSRFSVLEQFLLDRLTQPPHDYPAIMSAIQQFSASSAMVGVREVSDSMGYPAKRFIRLFHDYAGLTPKLFGRIQRFQSVLDQIVAGKTLKWTSIALDCGYYDQSHLIRDFRAFSGVTPEEYQPIEADRKNHMILE
ncbi:helix-turn-helix domain-containing protein [Gimesia aquarii]|uniref:DNA-binding transcriptional regulator GadX n=1 Tax=Gimesia aquarii TaxID=2527964 RepID=A0A517WYP7_9PLAN|nr:helix-turn-helix domain-containing protein [Gimesia aquarii]QDU10377.1 DNA-binding transcriptional regulator GadX [Gimesia aquarii]